MIITPHVISITLVEQRYTVQFLSRSFLTNSEFHRRYARGISIEMKSRNVSPAIFHGLFQSTAFYLRSRPVKRVFRGWISSTRRQRYFHESKEHDVDNIAAMVCPAGWMLPRKLPGYFRHQTREPFNIALTVEQSCRWLSNVRGKRVESKTTEREKKLPALPL